VNPKAILYYSCDKLVDHRELDQFFVDILKTKRFNNVSSSFILLDEVTYPREWYRSLKDRIDRGNFRNDILIMTGSLSVSVKREIETFPRRRGKEKCYLCYLSHSPVTLGSSITTLQGVIWTSY
jgi:predicted AAA+ superfamily ATPase